MNSWMLYKNFANLLTYSSQCSLSTLIPRFATCSIYSLQMGKNEK